MVVVTGGPGVADFVASLVGHGPLFFSFFFFNDTATTEIYTLSLHDALPISMGAAARGSFTGCAFCHEVKATANGVPIVTRPILIDRWMLQANFNHAKHQIDPATQKPLDCAVCHQAAQSRETSDVLMPSKANCTSCHSPQGKVVEIGRASCRERV